MHRISSFPTVRDLPALAPEDARAALAELRRFVKAELAAIYTQPVTPKGERPRWNIWFSRLAWPVGEQRIELPTWAAAWVATQHSPAGGDAA